MNQGLNNDAANTMLELDETELALVQGGSSVLPWLPPSFPIRNPLPLEIPEPYPSLTRPNVEPRPNPFVSSLGDLSVSIGTVRLGLL